MKKLVIVITALAFTLGVVAQTETPVKSETKTAPAPVKGDEKKAEPIKQEKSATAPVKNDTKKAPATTPNKSDEKKTEPIKQEKAAATPAPNDAKKSEKKQEKNAAKPAKTDAASKSQGMEHKSESGKAHQSSKAINKKTKKKSAVKPAPPAEGEVKGSKK